MTVSLTKESQRTEYVGKHRDDDRTKFYGRKWFEFGNDLTHTNVKLYFWEDDLI